jgi:hypothetical protein
MRWHERAIVAAFSADLRCIQAATRAYGRLWDATGIYIGTIRFVLLMGVSLPYGLYATYTAPRPWWTALLAGGTFTVLSSLLPFLHGLKAHLREDRAYQRAANYDRLNLQAMIWATGKSLWMRVSTIAIFFTVRPMLAAFGGDQSWALDPSIYVCALSWWAYGLSLGVVVPPRKRRAPKTAPIRGLEPLPA